MTDEEQNTNICMVLKREDDSCGEPFSSEKLLALLTELSFNLDVDRLNLEELASMICKLLPNKITVYELYDLVAESLASRVVFHPDHSILAGRVISRKLQLTLSNIKFSDNVARLNSVSKARDLSLLSEKFCNIVMEHKEFLDSIIDEGRDYEFSFFGIKTLEKSYLLKLEKDNRRSRKLDRYRDLEAKTTKEELFGVVETPQFMFLRVALGIHGEDMASVKETYDLMSQKYFIHASPTLYNAGSDFNFLSSCFLVAMEDDSIDGIYKTLHTTALVSKASGGIGLHVHNIRGNGSYIRSTNGVSSGLIPMLRVFNDTARYVDQGGNKRPGAFAIYLEPWHCDIFEVLNMRKNHGKEELRARDLFFGLWVPDLFMKRVKNDENWSLFSPDEAPGLADCYGDEFETLYLKYEKEGRAMDTVRAQKIWLAIIESQTETGGPYMLYKDSCNSKSNQQNLGVIKSSNLCCEIVEYSSPEETAVCNLGSLALPSFVSLDDKNGTVRVDFQKLHSVTKILTKNLNKVIDVTKYPVPSAELSNKRHRPVAVGVQGLADLFLELRLPFDSDEAKLVNIQVFETIYHAAVEASVELAKLEGKYQTFEGSPASKGLLQFDLWKHEPSSLYTDWDQLKADIQEYGLRNSLLVAPMPTASTSQILGFNECFEPYTSNIYTRRVLSGEYQIVNKYLLRDLIDLGYWNSSIKDKILVDNGSIQGIEGIPEEIKRLYKTVWEISQRTIIDMAADRARFIDQSQSMNIYMKDPTLGKLTSCHFYGWEKGLKTGMYYLRTQAASRAIQFTVNHAKQEGLPKLSPKVISSLKRNKYESVKQVGKRQSYLQDETDRRLKQRNVEPSYYATLSQTPDLDVEGNLEETYDIHDTTPIACDIKDPGNCESCSG
ncbi:ribonucleoside-diphosphate reductase large chain 2 [[Candida] railenensis]|uniref:Ribonucleoside-diphosphate reductase n=1 Tax=[Candida] railenensis TaxID=45579 RepID=A0A9P0VZC9_9ASCO|nr:ribonucleoside-diphosphate reductase large chain 2 [[Candida] railenensis]